MLKMKKLLPLLPMLFLAGCYNAPSTTIVEKPRAVGRANGVDLATDAGQVAHRLKDTGLHFVARYYRKPDSRWPTLSANEAKLISSMGLNLVTVWESHSRHPSYFTYSRGYYDAASAYNQAKTIGQPPNSAIYFAVDFDARGADVIPVDQYFRGVAAGFAAAGGGKPEYKVGVYGSGAVCDTLKRERLADYTWLSNSTAWAGSRRVADWNIRQGRPFAALAFINHDSNEARDDYGGFRLAGL
jgi:hypothetical protein